MSERSNSDIRTRAFARVIGPFVTIVTAIIIYRAPTLSTTLSGFFENGIIVWETGALLLASGLAIIAFHQYWRGVAAVLISLFGWFLTLRGIALLAAPELMERGVGASMAHPNAVRGGFAVLALIGLYFTYVGWIAKPHPGADAQ